MDGSSAPETLPQLPGSDVPSNSMTGKWKLVIHTAGMNFMRNAKVLVDQENTGFRVEDWLSCPRAEMEAKELPFHAWHH